MAQQVPGTLGNVGFSRYPNREYFYSLSAGLLKRIVSKGKKFILGLHRGGGNKKEEDDNRVRQNRVGEDVKPGNYSYS